MQVSSFFLQLAVASIMVSARTTELPEVVPGPGLPSLESLGLTSEQLYNMPSPLPPDSKLAMSPAFDGVCGPSERAYTDVDSLVACYHYLNKLGTQPCRAPEGRRNTHFCRAGSSHVNGVAITGKSESSHCKHVAKGLLYVIDSCTRPNKSCAGAQAAWGNGHLIVSGCHTQWA